MITFYGYTSRVISSLLLWWVLTIIIYSIFVYLLLVIIAAAGVKKTPFWHQMIKEANCKCQEGVKIKN